MSLGEPVKKTTDDEESGTDSPAPPDGGWGWMVVFGSFMIHIITDGVTYSFGIFYDEFLNYFKEGQAKTSWILSILVGVTLCSGPISSYFVNRWGCRLTTIAGAILASLCMVASFWATNVLTLCFTIGIGTGLGFGLIYLPAIVSVTMYFEKKRSLATGIAVCGSGFGTFIFAPIISKLMEHFGWRGSILILAGVVLECVLFGALFRPLEDDKQDIPENELKPTEAQTDLHLSIHDISNTLPLNGEANGSMHRPHSVAHFSLPRGARYEQNGNIRSTKGKSSDATRLALSQPMLTQSEIHHRHQHFGSQGWKKHGPLDRPDIFYQGSLMNIPSYRSKQSLRKAEEGPFMERRLSTYSYKRKHTDSEGEEEKVCGIFSCSEEIMEMLDCSLAKDVIFVVFVLSNLLTSIGFNIPYVFLVTKAKEQGIDPERASMLISIIGGANTIGRIVLGYISDKPWISRLNIYNWSLTLCGIATFISAFCNSFYSLAIYGTVFGFTIGAYVGLTSVILVDLLGLDKLTNAFGLLLLFQGIASLIGPPIAGALVDLMGSFNPAFILGGVTIALSGLVLFSIPSLQRWKAKQGQQVQTEEI